MLKSPASPDVVFNKEAIISKMKNDCFRRKHWPAGIIDHLPAVVIFVDRYNNACVTGIPDYEKVNMAIDLFMDHLLAMKDAEILARIEDRPIDDRYKNDLQQLCVHTGHLLCEILAGMYPNLAVPAEGKCVRMREAIMLIGELTKVVVERIYVPLTVRPCALTIN